MDKCTILVGDFDRSFLDQADKRTKINRENQNMNSTVSKVGFVGINGTLCKTDGGHMSLQTDVEASTQTDHVLAREASLHKGYLPPRPPFLSTVPFVRH